MEEMYLVIKVLNSIHVRESFQKKKNIRYMLQTFTDSQSENSLSPQSLFMEGMSLVIKVLNSIHVRESFQKKKNIRYMLQTFTDSQS